MNKRIKYAIAAVVLSMIVAAVFLLYHQAYRIDTDKILAHSVLKDKTFTSKVRQLEIDGIKAYFLEEHSNPIIAISFVFTNAGSAYEPENKQGLTLLLTDMLQNGAGHYNALQFKDAAEEYGIKIGFQSGTDEISGFLQMPTANLEKAAELLTSALYQPHFAPDYIALTKNQMQTALRYNKERPSSVLSDKFAEIIFAGHPYSRPAIGLEETIAGINRADLKDFMRKHFTKSNLIIGIAGDINDDKAKKLLYDIFGRLPAEFSQEPVAKIKLKSTGAKHYVDFSSPQTITQFVSKGTSRNSADFYPLYLANYIFGGSGLNSKISKVIREDNGLTYGIYTYLSIKETAALILGNYSSTPQNFALAQKLLHQEWQKMAASGVTKEELQQAKDALIASYNLRFASIDGIADMLTAMQQYNLGIDFLEKRNDYIKAVSLEQVNAAAKKYFNDEPDFVIVGKKTEQKEK